VIDTSGTAGGLERNGIRGDGGGGGGGYDRRSM
jgi:hypothetical protein